MGWGFRSCKGREGTEELSNQNQRAGTVREEKGFRRRAELSFLVSVSCVVCVSFLLTPGELWEPRLAGL